MERKAYTAFGETGRHRSEVMLERLERWRIFTRLLKDVVFFDACGQRGPKRRSRVTTTNS